MSLAGHLERDHILSNTIQHSLQIVIKHLATSKIQIQICFSQISLNMKAFTAIIAIGSLLSVTLASPLSEVNFEETAMYTAEDLAEHHVEARQLPGLPPVPIPTKPADIVPALQTILKRATAVLTIARGPPSLLEQFL